MNDDSLTPEAELASAALDNEVTEVERARVTGSQSLSDELAFYADLRSRLADVPVPSEARESALAAALAAYDDVHASPSEAGLAVAAAKVAAIAPVVSLRARRQRQYRWIGGAAAAAVVTVLAVGVIGNLGGGSSDESSSAVLFTTAGSEQKSVEPAPSAAAAAPAQEATGDEPAAADETTEQMSEPSGGLEAIDGAADVSEWVAAPRLETEDAVIAFVTSDAFTEARVAADEPPADVTAEAPATGSADTTAAPPAAGVAAAACPQLSIGPFAAVTYQGIDVYVVVDEANREFLIVDPLDCSADEPVRLP